MRLLEIETPAASADLITMWHGGRGLEYSYREMLGNKAKQMEHGPGLYLTSYYTTASKYAKGGGKTYLVSFRRGTEIREVTLRTLDVLAFIKGVRFTNKRELVPYIQENYPDTIPARNVLNLLVNYGSLTPATSAVFRQFLVDNGVDYEVTHNAGGFNDQSWVVIFNPKIIQDVKIVPPSQVTQDMFKLPVDL